MLRISKKVEYGVMALFYLETLEEGEQSASRDIAEKLELPAGLLGKVLQALARAGLIASSHGSRGGYRLQVRLDQVMLGDVLAALEGPVALARCQDEPDACELNGQCAIQDSMSRVRDEFADYMNQLPLSSFRARLAMKTEKAVSS